MQQISPLIPPTSENPPVFSMTLHHVLFLVLIITTFYIPPSFFKTSSAHCAFKLMESCAIKMYTVIRMIPAGHRITDNILSGPFPAGIQQVTTPKRWVVFWWQGMQHDSNANELANCDYEYPWRWIQLCELQKALSSCSEEKWLHTQLSHPSPLSKPRS